GGADGVVAPRGGRRFGPLGRSGRRPALSTPTRRAAAGRDRRANAKGSEPRLPLGGGPPELVRPAAHGASEEARGRADRRGWRGTVGSSKRTCADKLRPIRVQPSWRGSTRTRWSSSKAR